MTKFAKLGNNFKGSKYYRLVN